MIGRERRKVNNQKKGRGVKESRGPVADVEESKGLGAGD
jgi:hypothetical protein